MSDIARFATIRHGDMPILRVAQIEDYGSAAFEYHDHYRNELVASFGSGMQIQ